jgi:Carboxypeptidase regulatory-like domain/TonB dependent receptor
MESDFNALCGRRDFCGESEREQHLYVPMPARQASSRTIAACGKGSRSKATLAAILLFLLMCSMSTVLPAQSAASINGTVKDSTGALLSGANVVLTNSDTGVKQQVTTNNAGIYAIPNVRPGSYAIVVDKDGFESVKETQVVLQVNQAATFNFSLAVGAIVSTVEVSSGASSVETSTAELGTVITTRAVNDLPLNGRNFTQLLELTPGVSRVSVDQNSSGGGGISGNAIGTFTFPSVNGQRNRSNMFLLDGVNDLGSYFGTYNYEPIVDGIQEFKVQSHNDLAEFGGVTGGIVNVVTKGGSNAIHGSVWEFLRNSAFDARNYFLPTVNPLRQNQFGGTIGGPVVIPHVYNGHNKTFFFFAYEGFRNSQAAQSLLTTPTAAQLNGDFSNLLAKGVVIYDPFSTRPDPAHPGQYLRDPFPNNQIPTQSLSAAALLYARTIFPAPNASNLPGGRNLIDTTPSRLNDNNYSGRIDQAFGDHDLLFGRVSYFNEPSSASGGFPGAVNTTTVYGWNMAVHEEHVFGPRAMLELSFGRNVGYAKEASSLPVAPANFSNQLLAAGFSNQFIGSFGQPTIPEFAITGYLSNVGSGGNIITYHQFSNTWEYAGNYTLNLGHHTLKFGGSYASNNYQLADVEAQETTGTFQTANLENPTSATGASTGDALASFLLGVPSAAGFRNTTETEHGGSVNSLYVQDQIQVNSHLAVNVGLRWDVSVWPVLSDLSNGAGYVGDMDLNNGTYIIRAVPPACSPTVGAPCIPGGVLPAHVVVSNNKSGSLHDTDFSNWQGRLGIAYHPLDKLSIMAGYSRFYDNWNGVTQLAQDVGGTWPSVGILTAATLNTNAPQALIGDPLLQGNGSVVTPAATPFNNNGTFYNPNLKTPLVDQWNLGIAQGFGTNTVFSLTYSGSHSSRLDIHALNNTAEYAAPGTAAQVASRRMYPYIVPITYDNSTGNSNYNALQTTLKRTTSNGLTYLVSYTWSKSIDLACSGIFGGCLLQNPYNPRADRSVSGFDLPNMLSASVVYQLPFGRTKSMFSDTSFPGRLANGALGGWSVNGIASYTSGTPYSVTVSGDIANTGNTAVQANLVGNPTPSHRTASEWINPAAFVAPPRFTFGTFGRNSLRSDSYKNLDLSVFKNFALPREASLQFRAEAFNATNSVVFSAPSSVVGSTTFGSVGSTANTPRELQLALKVLF